MRPGMEGARRCKYRAEYYDFEAEELREWECDMPALPGREYCLFHDPEYWREHPEEVREAFYERVREAMASEESAYFIGYHLPRVDLRELGEDVVFRGPVYFNEAVFHEDASFLGASFSGPTSFNRAKFLGDAIFIATKFSKDARFDGASFSEHVIFIDVVFSYASFNHARFSREARFFSVEFLKGADLISCVFAGPTIFSHVRFPPNARLENLVISGRTVFSNTYLPSILDDPLDLESRLCLRYIVFDGGGKLIFSKTNMDRVSFMFADLSRVEFWDVRWWEYKGSFMPIDAMIVLIKTNDKIARQYKEMARKDIRDREERHLTPQSELLRLPDDPDLTLENVLQEIRLLKNLAISMGRYEEAAKFHIAEMEVRRLAGPEAKERHVEWPPKGRLDRLRERAGSWLERRLLWLYKATCLYGESLARPVAWLLAIWLLFGFIYAFSGLIAVPGLATALQLLAEGLAFSGSVVVLMLLLRAAPVVAAWGYIAWAEGALALLIYAVFLPTIMRRIWRLVRA